MSHIKNPSNRNSLPSIIISDYDENKIKEIKVKYLKLARLDRITIQKMRIENNQILFEKVSLNNQEIEINNQQKIIFNNYEITGYVKPSKKRIFLKRNGKEMSFFEYENFKFEYQSNDEKIEKIETKAKYILTIKDKNQRNEEKELRSKTTEREIPNNNLIDTYKQISGFENVTSQDIYKIKRYIDFKNEMMFYFQFIEEFFAPVLNVNQNFYSFKFEEKENKTKLLNLFKYRLNDDFKNQILKEYIIKDEIIKNDFIKIKNILASFRHALAHFDFDFIQKFFDDKLDREKYNINNISLIKILLEKNEEKIYEEKNNYIEDADIISIFDNKDIELSKINKFFIKISQKKPAFNKLINSFLSKDGIENQEFKEYLKTKNYDYFEDIHTNSKYKKIYISHKELIGKKQALEFGENPDGQKLKEFNDKLQKLKEEMNNITKENSLKRVEVKLRLAFGFIANEYDYKFKNFNENFTLDIKDTNKILKYKTSSNEKLKQYFESTFSEKSFFNYKTNFKDKKTGQTIIKDKSIFNLIENETLESIVNESNILQIITLLYLFIPKELQGEFVGFILKIYHHTKNISTDTKQDEVSIENTQNSFSLKLKILAKTLRGLQLFKYSLSHNTLFNKKEEFFYEKGNKWKNIYKNLQISHNLDEFDIHLVVPIIKYHINLFKLLGDFEIYALLRYAKKENLEDKLSFLTNNLKYKNHYNFGTLLNKVFNIDTNYKNNPSNIQHIKQLRNDISHQNIKNIIDSFEKNIILSQREEIINYLKTMEDDIKQTLYYNPINDFTMKTIQYLKSLNVHSQKDEKIENISKKQNLVPNDYFIIYKLKAIETIKKELISSIGITKYEEKIQRKIAISS